MYDFLMFWKDVLVGIGIFLSQFWYVLAIYVAIYFGGAAVTFLTLRLNKTSEGRLGVDRQSWLYFLAHPNISARSRASWKAPEVGNICPLYARAFHMLLFAWPFFLAYNIVSFLFINIIRLFGDGSYAVVDYAEEGWIRTKKISWTKRIEDGRSRTWRRKELPTGAWIIIVPAGILFLILTNRAALVKGIYWVCVFLLYALPALLLIGLIVILIWYFRSNTNKEGKVALVKEYFSKAEEKMCKTVEIS